MRRDPRISLTDIDQAGADIESFTAGMDLDSYIGDRRTQAAVERKFEIIGEAMNRLFQEHPEFAKQVSGFRQIIDFRNQLVHGYDSVESEIVWHHSVNHLPQLRLTVQALLAELESAAESSNDSAEVEEPGDSDSCNPF